MSSSTDSSNCCSGPGDGTNGEHHPDCHSQTFFSEAGNGANGEHHPDPHGQPQPSSWTTVNEIEPNFVPRLPKQKLQAIFAFWAIQHLATNSMARWSVKTFQLVMPGIRIYPGKGVRKPDERTTDDIVNWWRISMIRLFNHCLKTNMSPDDYSYRNHADQVD